MAHKNVKNDVLSYLGIKSEILGSFELLLFIFCLEGVGIISLGGILSVFKTDPVTQNLTTTRCPETLVPWSQISFDEPKCLKTFAQQNLSVRAEAAITQRGDP